MKKLVMREIEKLFINGKPRLYTYREIGALFGVRDSTVRKWKSQGLFKILGYRRISRFNKEAVVSPLEVLKLFLQKIEVEGGEGEKNGRYQNKEDDDHFRR